MPPVPDVCGHRADDGRVCGKPPGEGHGPNHGYFPADLTPPRFTPDDEALDAAVREAIAVLTLAISDALGPVRPVSGTAAHGGRRSTRVLLRAINRAGGILAGPDAQRAYDNLAAASPASELDVPLDDDPEDTYDDRTPSTSVRAIPAGLPTLGRGHR